MHTQKQILTIGIIFIVTFTIVFFNIRAEFKNKSDTTKSEILGMKQIVDIHNLDVLLKSVRGISQLEKEDAKSLKSSLFISEEKVLMTIKTLKDTRIEELYNDIILKQKVLSKMELFEKYTKLLELLQNKRIDIADKYHLLFEGDRSIYFLITTIVIVDDERDILEVLEQFLSRTEKFDITTFSNPVDALPRVKNGEFDLVLLDIMMPQMDGIDFLKEIKESSSSTKVIMMTAYSTQDRVIECNKIGAEDYITKPFISLRDVENKVLDILGL